MQGARDFVHITGWHLAPHSSSSRGEPPVVARRAAGRAGRAHRRARARVGRGAGAGLPSRLARRCARPCETLTRGTRIRCELDPREHPFHCHHEKTIIIDGELAFVGGIDLTDDAGDRFDSSAHPARRRLGWHDVGTRLRGPAVADVARPLRAALARGDRRAARAPGAAPPPAGDSTVQVVRTVAEDMYDDFPHGDFRILESYMRALRSAQRLDLPGEPVPVVAGDRRRSSPTSCATRRADDFRLVVLLPAKANNGQDDTRGQLGVLAAADDDAGRFLAATIRSRTGERDDPLYVHAKVGIVDDRWLTVGSANLNAHSLLNDTEMNVVTDDAELARATRVRLWAEHLELDPATSADADPVRGRRRALAPDRRRAARAPRARGSAHPPAARAARRLAALGPPARPAGGPHGRRLTAVSRALCAASRHPDGHSVRAVAKVRRCFWKTPTPSPRRTDGGERGTHRAFGPRGESPAEGRRSARLTARARQLTP